MYDLAIIGAGPAGMTAAIYARRAGINTIILEKAYPGGQMVLANSIENYPGFTAISGAELSMTMKKQLEGVSYKTAEITDVVFSDDVKIIKTETEEIQTKFIIIATGASCRRLPVSGEPRLFGRGISYCATCDGAFYRGKRVAVIGGGNTALDDSLYLANFCESVSLIHRRTEFRGDKITLDKVFSTGKITVYTDSVLIDILGDTSVSAIEIENVKTNIRENLPVSGVFGAIGYIAGTDFLKGKVELTDSGAIITDQNMKTNIDNVYAVGDVRDKEFRQIVTACSDGAAAVDIIRRLL